MHMLYTTEKQRERNGNGNGNGEREGTPRSAVRGTAHRPALPLPKSISSISLQFLHHPYLVKIEREDKSTPLEAHLRRTTYKWSFRRAPYDVHDKISEKCEFVVRNSGIHRFCFNNKSPYHETIDFDIHVGHFTYLDQHAKDEHFKPVLEQILKLEEALYNIQFEAALVRSSN